MRTLALFAIGIIFGGAIGFVTAAGMGVTFDGHDHGDPTHHGGTDHAGMDHDTPLEVGMRNAPLVQIALSADPMSGYNLNVITQNFAFAPEQANREHAAGQGHGHVYVNGEKQGRIYGPWLHLASLPKGEVTVEVTLNSNNHQLLTVDGAPVSASTTITVE